MLTSSQLQLLLTQFQAHYPMGCLYAELLTIHQEQYVVRSVVQSAGMTLATAMAAAPDIETAEDHAKIRALEALGLAKLDLVHKDLAHKTAPSLAYAAAPAVPAVVVQSPLAELGAESPSGASKVSPIVGGSNESRFSAAAANWPKPEPVSSKPDDAHPVQPSQPSQPSAEPALPYTSSLTQHSEADPTPESIDRLAFRSEMAPITEANPVAPAAIATTLPAANSPASPSPTSTIGSSPALETASKPDAKPEKSSKRKPESFEIAPAVTPSREQNDRSEEIMKIGIEMKRLGWSTEQGREYLKRTYGKRSRQELDDAELLDFLHYLELQPSPLQTPF